MHDGEGKVVIPPEAFHELLREYAPHLRGGAEYVVGPICLDEEGGLDITVAWSTECNPIEWARPPAFLRLNKKES